MTNLPNTPGSISGDDRKQLAQPGEWITFESAFMDARRPAAPPKLQTDPQAAIATARRQWADRKANAHRTAEPAAVSPAADPRTALADARAAKLTRLANAYRGSR